MRTRFFSLAPLALAGALSLGAAGCFEEEEEGPAVYASSEYEPMYYDGSVVYYDDLGHPYYYSDGVAVWVPATAPLYVGYVDHWRYYGPAYHRWYAGYGWRYRGYHYPHAYYRGGYYRGGGYYHGGHGGGRHR
jgi:hypothetical protein